MVFVMLIGVLKNVNKFLTITKHGNENEILAQKVLVSLINNAK